MVRESITCCRTIVSSRSALYIMGMRMEGDILDQCNAAKSRKGGGARASGGANSTRLQTRQQTLK